MDKLGLSDADLKTYLATISGPVHERLIEFTVTDLDGKNPVTLAPLVLSGQVSYNRKNIPARTLEATFVDVDGRLPFDSSAKDNPIHRKSLIEVRDWRLVPELGRWVAARPFTGVVYELDRSGAEVNIVAHGKEQLAMGDRWSPRSWGKKKRKTDIIKALFRDTGERNIKVPSLKARTTTKLLVRRSDKPLRVARRLASSMNRQLFFDGRGRLRLRRLPKRVVHTFDRAWLLGEIDIDRTPDGVFNVFTARGKKPKGKKRKRPSATVWLPNSHPNSAQSLARNGEPLRLVRTVTNSQLRSKRACRKKAQRMRDHAAEQEIAATAEVLPLPNLDEGDMVKVDDGLRSFWVRADEFALPLTNDGGMSLGDTRRVGTRRGRRTSGPESSGVIVGEGED